jgi:DNA-binding NarL/FixJ family response regulator
VGTVIALILTTLIVPPGGRRGRTRVPSQPRVHGIATVPYREAMGRSTRQSEQEAPSRAVPATRLLLVDDHLMFSESLRRLLETEPDIEVAATAASVAEACIATDTYEPDVVVLDYLLPDGTGADAAQRIRHHRPDLKLLMLTGREDGRTMAAAIEAGCDAFVAKRGPAEDVVHAVRALAAGRTALPRPLLSDAMPFLARRKGALTRREREVLQLVSEGRSVAGVAAALGVAPTTVRNHVQRAMTKLKVHSRTEAIAAAVREGLIRGPARD